MITKQILRPTQENQEDTNKLGLQEAYNLYIQLDKNEQEYNKIRQGIKIKFDIYEEFNGLITIKHKKQICIIAKKIYKLNDLYTELEQRLILIKKRIQEEKQKGTPLFEIRGIEDILKLQKMTTEGKEGQ